MTIWRILFIFTFIPRWFLMRKTWQMPLLSVHICFHFTPVTWPRWDGAFNKGGRGAFSCWSNHHISAISEWLLTPPALFKWPRSENSPTVRKDHPDWPRTDSFRNAVKASCLSATLTLIFIIFSEGCYRDECSCSLRKLLQVLGRYCIMPTFVTSLGYLKSPLATTRGNTGLQTL